MNSFCMSDVSKDIGSKIMNRSLPPPFYNFLILREGVFCNPNRLKNGSTVLTARSSTHLTTEFHHASSTKSLLFRLPTIELPSLAYLRQKKIPSPLFLENWSQPKTQHNHRQSFMDRQAALLTACVCVQVQERGSSQLSALWERLPLRRATARSPYQSSDVCFFRASAQPWRNKMLNLGCFWSWVWFCVCVCCFVLIWQRFLFSVSSLF